MRHIHILRTFQKVVVTNENVFSYCLFLLLVIVPNENIFFIVCSCCYNESVRGTASD